MHSHRLVPALSASRRPALRSLGLVVLVLLASALYSFPRVIAQERTAAPENSDDAIELLYQWLDVMRSVQSSLDLSETKAQDLVFASEFSAEKLIDFVTNDIAFEQYAGTMRGKAGTLAVRAGNALDQSILLASLLKDAGFEARIAYGDLNESQVDSLLGQIFHPLREQIVFTEQSARAVEKIIEFSGQTVSDEPAVQDNEFHEALTARGESMTAALQTALRSTDIDLHQRPVPTQIIDEAGSYYWVQFRLSPGDEWQDAHPALHRNEVSLGSLEPEGYFGDSIPDDKQQRISLQVKAIRRVGERREEVELTSLWERPVANMLDIGIPVRIVTRAEASAAVEPGSGSSSDIFLPLFGDAVAPGGMAFTLGGIIVDAEAAMSNMAGVFAEVSAKTGRAASALMGLGAGDAGDEQERPAMEIEAIWLEIGLRIPGQDERVVFQRQFAAKNGGSPIKRNDLVKSMHVEVQFGPEAIARRLHRIIDIHIEAVELAIQQHFAASSESGYDSLIGSLRPNGEVDWRALDGNTVFGYLANYRSPDPERYATYLDEPRIVIKHRNLALESADPAGMDIVNNSRRSFAIDDEGSMSFHPDLSFAAGVWEAVAEDEAVDLESEDSISAVSISLQASEDGAFRVVEALKGLEDLDGLSNESRERMAEAIRNNRVVIVPRPDEPRSWVAWWEMERDTGELSGVLENGWGGGFIFAASPVTERLVFKPVIFVMCGMVATFACTTTANIAVATLQMAAMSGGGPAAAAMCKFVVGAIIRKGAGTWGICASFTVGIVGAGVTVAQALNALKKPIANACMRLAGPKCLKAALVAP